MILTSSTVVSFLKLNAADLERIDAIIEWAQARAELIIGRSLESKERVEYLDGHYSQSIMLPVIPISSIESISLDARRRFTTTLSTDDYFFHSARGIITLYNYLTPQGNSTVRVAYTAGYTEDTLPADLKMALMECVSWNLKRINDEALGISTRNAPDGVNVGYEMVLPMGAQRVFESHRDVRC